MTLSRFFTLPEMTRSDTAIREGIPNDPTPTELANLKALCEKVLDPLRESVGRPIKVNSGYRGPALNRRIGGAGKSQHMEGKAADIQSDISVLELFKTVIRLGLPFDQLIYEAPSRKSRWVHVSHDPTRARGNIMIADFGPDGRARGYPVISAEDALQLTESATRSVTPEVLDYIEQADEPEAMTEAAAAPAPRARAAPKRRKTAARKRASKKAVAKRRASATKKKVSRVAAARAKKRAPRRK